MKQILFAIIAVGFLATSCNQQEDISGKIEASVNQKANRMVDSLKNVCNKNFDTQLQSRVAAAIKSNNQLTASPKPTVKPKSNAVTKPKSQVNTTTASKPQKPVATGGRSGIGKGGGLLKNNTGIKKPKAATNAQPGTTTTTVPSNTTDQGKKIRTRPGTKGKNDGGN